jgi:hypothetical protein
LAHIAALNKAKPKIDKGIGLSSNEVAPKKARAQNQPPKKSVSLKAIINSSSTIYLRLCGLISEVLLAFILVYTLVNLDSHA